MVLDALMESADPPITVLVKLDGKKRS